MKRKIVIVCPEEWDGKTHKNFTATFAPFLKNLYSNWPSVKVVEYDEVDLK